MKNQKIVKTENQLMSKEHILEQASKLIHKLDELYKDVDITKRQERFLTTTKKFIDENKEISLEDIEFTEKLLELHYQEEKDFADSEWIKNGLLFLIAFYFIPYFLVFAAGKTIEDIIKSMSLYIVISPILSGAIYAFFALKHKKIRTMLFSRLSVLKLAKEIKTQNECVNK